MDKGYLTSPALGRHQHHLDLVIEEWHIEKAGQLIGLPVCRKDLRLREGIAVFVHEFVLIDVNDEYIEIAVMLVVMEQMADI